MLEQQDPVNHKFFMIEKARQETIRQIEMKKSLLEQLANSENTGYEFTNEELDAVAGSFSSKNRVDIMGTFFIDNTLSVSVIRSIASDFSPRL